jgi:ribosomal protein S18 acetylase RimI-like enzyme
MQIRLFTEADTASVRALWSSIFASPTPHNDPDTAIRKKLAVQPELFFVAEIEGVVVGTVMGGYDGHRGWIYSLAVHPPFRNRGVGTALMRHIERQLALRGCPKINLQLLPTNAATAAFYQKLGYAVEERVSLGKVLPAPSSD